MTPKDKIQVIFAVLLLGLIVATFCILGKVAG
jgi:hypothetical protein